MKKLNIDTLGKMSDNEVDFLMKKIKHEIHSINDSRKKKKGYYEAERLFDVQTEYCYVKREFDSRFSRRESHRLYLESNPRRYEDLFLN
tara:strand:- start:28 stop:294 length:267 start_codon:yes stop_codon:yes gene_type:complete